MRRLALILTFVLLAAACRGESSTTSVVNDPTTTTIAPLESPATTTSTSTTTTLAPPASTGREITPEELIFMNPDPDALGPDYRGFDTVTLVAEANEEMIRQSVLDPGDEGQDITTFGRTGGARIEMVPRRALLGGGDLRGVQTWVSLFATDEGAHGYLLDFVQDAAKGIGGGRPIDLAVTRAQDFPVDELGQEAVGLILTQGRVGEAPRMYETLVAFRIGRLLGFASVYSVDESDRRVRAIGLAQALEDRVIAVLEGELVPPPGVQDEIPIDAYAFTYHQKVAREGSKAEVRSSGVVLLPDQLQCLVEFAVVAGVDVQHEYVVDGDSIWVDGSDAAEPGFQPIGPENFDVDTDLLYCPGWPVSVRAWGLDAVLGEHTPEPIEVDGTAALGYTLEAEALVAVGFLPEGSAVSVDRFEVVVDKTHPWIRAVGLQLSGSASTFRKAFGPSFASAGGGRVTMTIEATASRFNDPELTVEIPGL